MKTITKITTLLLTLLVVVFASCSKDKHKETILTADDLFTSKAVTFEGLAGDQTNTIHFTAPASWTAEIHCIGSWLSADVLRGGAGEAAIVLRPVSDNFGTTAREATLSIYIDGYAAYTIQVYQNSAATGDIQINGHVSDGVMTLSANDTGTEFSDTIWVVSSRKWTLVTDGAASGVLSFETDGTPMNGVERTVRVVVKASYASFDAPGFEGRFYIRTEEGAAVPLTVRAAAAVGIYEREYPSPAEAERTSYQLTDTLQRGVFAADFYIESNVRWTVGSMPEWLETGNGTTMPTNVLTSGKINPRRQHVSFRVKRDALSRDGKSGVISLNDARGETVKTISVTFAGVGSDYTDYSMSFPANDPYGNPWGFEAKASSINPDVAEDYWKEVSHEFTVTTSADFTSVKDAPFHLVMVRADNGIAQREEVHWAKFEMGSGAATRTGDLYTRNMFITVNDRGDADDKEGRTDPTQWRYALVYILPARVSFSDLWGADGNLKAEYADDMVLIAQKNDPAAAYTFAVKEVADGGTLSVPGKGGTITLNVLPGSYAKCNVNIEQQSQDGAWAKTAAGVCDMDFTMQGDAISTVTFTLSENKAVTNPFTHTTTGAPRHLRVSFVAFIGDAEATKTIFTFYIDQALKE